MEYTTEQFKEKFQKLPPDLRKTLLTDDIGIEVQLIGRDTGITTEQALDVEDVVVSVLVGTSHPKDFIRNIREKIGVDEEGARAIAEKVNKEIFQPVRESLKIVHNITDDSQPITDNQSPTTPIESIGTLTAPRHTTPSAPPVPPSQIPNSSPIPPRPPRQTMELSFSHGAEGNRESQPFPEMIRPEGVALKEVPRPQPASGASEPPARNIFEQKLKGVFAMPREETLLPPKPSRNTGIPQKPGVDPYREPTK